MTDMTPGNATTASPSVVVDVASSPVDLGIAVSRDRAYLMDVLRGLLASWVVLHHIVLSSGTNLDAYPWRLFAHHGQEAVLVFFMLSGFAIMKSLYAQPQRWLSFLIARFWRIYPVYLIALIVGIGAWVYADYRADALFSHLSGLGIAPWPPTDVSPGWLHILLHLFQLQGMVPSAWLPHADTTLVAPAWSLSTEFQFYAIAPALFLLLAQARSGNASVIALMLVVAVILSNLINNPSIAPANVLHYIDLFVFGMIGAIAHQSQRFGKFAYCLSAVVVAAGGLLSGRGIVATAVSVWMLFWWLSTLAPVERLTDTKVGRICLLIGALSFPLYLIHYPLSWLLLIAATDLLPENRMAVLALWVPIALTSSYIAALLLHRYVEVPATRYGKRTAKRREMRYGRCRNNRLWRQNLPGQG